MRWNVDANENLGLNATVYLNMMISTPPPLTLTRSYLTAICRHSLDLMLFENSWGPDNNLNGTGPTLSKSTVVFGKRKQKKA